MIFRGVRIDGFGVWHDLELSDLGPGLNVFLAPNEGGKSTLMAFIRAVLFGFKRRSDPNRYEPLRGGRHGGFISCETGGTGYRVTRIDDGTSRGEAVVTGDDGRKFEPGKLGSLLRSTTETLYENVFAFGLEELQRLDTLQAEDVAGHIYSAGMGAGPLNPVAFRQQIQEALERSYRPRGKKPAISRLLSEIEATQDRLENRRQKADAHADLARRRKRLQERRAQHNATLERRQDEYEDLTRLETAWPQYQKLLEAEATFEAVGVAPARMRIAPSERSLNASEASAGAGIAVEEAASGMVDTEQLEVLDLMSAAHRTLLTQASRIRGLMSNAERLRELHASVDARQREARHLRHALFNDLEEMGGEWSLDRVRAVRTDVTVRDEIRQWSERVQEAETQIRTTEGRATDANLVYQAMRENREQIGRGTLLATWGLIAVAIAATATLVPASARLTSSLGILSVGLLMGTVMTWLYQRGMRHRRTDQGRAAQREAELWQRHNDANDALATVADEWKDWLRGQGLPPELSTQGTLDLLDRLRQSQDKDRRAQAAETTVDTAMAELQRACMTVLSVLEQLDRQAMDLRYDTLKMVDPLLSTIGELQAEVEAVEENRERIRRVLDEYARARAGLRALAGEEGATEFQRRLEATNPESLARALGEAQGHLVSARADRDAINESLGALRQQSDDLENDVELSNLLQARETQRTDLVERLHEWAGHAVCAALYDEAKRKYEAERQPEVVRLASRYFEMMTDGRYTRVIAPLGENRLEVEQERGDRLPPSALSRGTGEQLYLSMRLALAKAYGDQAVPLPLVADDILVNFDDDRARATAALLDLYASEGHQILAFTCHRHLVRTFESHAPEAQIRALPAHA